MKSLGAVLILLPLLAGFASCAEAPAPRVARQKSSGFTALPVRKPAIATSRAAGEVASAPLAAPQPGNGAPAASLSSMRSIAANQLVARENAAPQADASIGNAVAASVPAAPDGSAQPVTRQ